MNENLYLKLRFKVVKFSNYETPSPNFLAPLSPISFLLINLKIQYDFRFFISSNNNNILRIKISINDIFYLKSRFKIVKFSNLETPSPNFPDPSSPILLYLIILKIHYEFRFF
jgi:hypothetical protein